MKYEDAMLVLFVAGLLGLGAIVAVVVAAIMQDTRL